MIDPWGNSDQGEPICDHDCPHCGGEMWYDKGDPGGWDEPPMPAGFVCKECEHFESY